MPYSSSRLAAEICQGSSGATYLCFLWFGRLHPCRVVWRHTVRRTRVTQVILYFSAPFATLC